jgi:hypothetical protein
MHKQEQPNYDLNAPLMFTQKLATENCVNATAQSKPSGGVLKACSSKM